MPSIGNDKLQALWCVEASARAEIEIGRIPFLGDPVLKFFHRLGVMRVDTPLQVMPKILDGVEIRTPRREVDDIDAMIVKPGPTRTRIVRRSIILLVPPLSCRPEGMSRLDEIECKDRLVAPRVQCALIQLSMS